MVAGVCLVVLGVPQWTRAQVGFDNSADDRVRLWNADYYELAIRKSDGRLLSLTDKTTGQEVSPGNIHGPWVLRFSDNTWLDGQSFSPTNASRRFTYAWNGATGTLNLDYAATGTHACHVVVEVQATEGPEFVTRLTLDNQSSRSIELLAYPVQFSFRRNEIDALYVPYIEGMRLAPAFFDGGHEFNSGYPGQLFADFAYTDLSSGAFAMYSVRDNGLPLIPSTLLVLRDDSYAGGSYKYHHDYDLAVEPGAQWIAPKTVFSVGVPLETAMAAYWSRNGHDAMPTLADKLGSSQRAALANAVLLKADFLQGSWTFASFANWLPSLPAGSLLHFVAFWQRGFDENYPDYLPPNAALGSQADFVSLVAGARGAGFLVMPYTNPTWWDNESPTLAALGTGIVARDRSGNLRYETYGVHGGYVISPFSSAAAARRAQTRDEFTQTAPCDFLFEDQVGARGPTFDGHPDAPAPMQYNQGLIDMAAASAQRLPIMTEGGYDRLAWVESGFCNSHRVGWHWWPESTYTAYPMAQLWAHENLYFSTHNLAGLTMTVDLPALTYDVAMGYSLSFDLSSFDAAWLNVVDAFQKHLVADLVGTEMTGFALLTDNVSRTTFGNGVEITANMKSSLRIEPMAVISPHGFLAVQEGDVVGGVFAGLCGQALSGSTPHYLLFDHKPYRVDIRQPAGDDGAVPIARPPSWTDDGRIQAAARMTSGALADRPVTIQGDNLVVDYVQSIGGAAVDYFRVVYCRQGDADCDGDLDAADYVAFEDCTAGPGQAPSPTPPGSAGACRAAFDFDADNDVDLADFAAWAALAG